MTSFEQEVNYIIKHGNVIESSVAELLLGHGTIREKAITLGLPFKRVRRIKAKLLTLVNESIHMSTQFSSEAI